MPFPKPQQAVSSPDSAQSTLTRPMAAKASFTSPLKGTRSINDPHCGAHGFSCLRMFEREQSAVGRGYSFHHEQSAIPLINYHKPRAKGGAALKELSVCCLCYRTAERQPGSGEEQISVARLSTCLGSTFAFDLPDPGRTARESRQRSFL